MLAHFVLYLWIVQLSGAGRGEFVAQFASVEDCALVGDSKLGTKVGAGDSTGVVTAYICPQGGMLR